MPLSSLIIPILALAAAAEEPPITVRGYPWAPFISPMGEPFRSPASGEAPIARWFVQADLDRDGLLTAQEMQRDADRFFARLDDNGDGQVDPQEITSYEVDIAPDVQVNSNWKRQRGDRSPTAKRQESPLSFGSDQKAPGDRHDGYRPDGLQGGARYGLLNIPQPVAGADADFNRLVTLAEFRQAAAYRFKLLDADGDGRLTLATLAEKLPTRPKGRSPTSRKDAIDSRIGLPLPDSN